MTPFQLKSLRATAKRYRREEPRTPAGGVVLIYRGQAFGWKNCLGSASCVVPDSFAVNESGQIWQGTGGNDYDGARGWVLLSPLPGQKGLGVSPAAPAQAGQVEGTCLMPIGQGVLSGERQA